MHAPINCRLSPPFHLLFTDNNTLSSRVQTCTSPSISWWTYDLHDLCTWYEHDTKIYKIYLIFFVFFDLDTRHESIAWRISKLPSYGLFLRVLNPLLRNGLVCHISAYSSSSCFVLYGFCNDMSFRFCCDPALMKGWGDKERVMEGENEESHLFIHASIHSIHKSMGVKTSQFVFFSCACILVLVYSHWEVRPRLQSFEHNYPKLIQTEYFSFLTVWFGFGFDNLKIENFRFSPSNLTITSVI